MSFLLGAVKSLAKINQVEIDAVNLCATQVGATEICLADFFGRLEILFVILVGVKSGAAVFTGDGAVDQSAPRRAQMKSAAAQVGLR